MVDAALVSFVWSTSIGSGCRKIEFAVRKIHLPRHGVGVGGDKVVLRFDAAVQQLHRAQRCAVFFREPVHVNISEVMLACL